MNGGALHADATPEEAWNELSSNPAAALVDVRTAAEWTFVGTPDLGDARGSLVRVEWQTYPDMTRNPTFSEAVDRALRESGSGPDAPVYFLCRSGARSASAATAMMQAGYRHCFNVVGGFEGARDEEGHRGTKEGWKAARLPWSQP
jgi:rhodanese-related sulfurtransferase